MKASWIAAGVGGEELGCLGVVEGGLLRVFGGYGLDPFGTGGADGASSAERVSGDAAVAGAGKVYGAGVPAGVYAVKAARQERRGIGGLRRP